MALRIELRQRGVVVDGVETWWDDVEIALRGAGNDYPILEAISPYGYITIPKERLENLAIESRGLAQATSGAVHALMLKIADLCDQASSAIDAELRFDGD